MEAMSTMPVSATRSISLSREGQIFRLTFGFNEQLQAKVRLLFYAEFDSGSRTWTAAVCSQTLDGLRQLHWDGLVDVDPDTLLEPGEQLITMRAASLQAGSTRRPFMVRTATRDEHLYARLTSIPGSRWEPKAKGISYGPTASLALCELVDRGVLDDPMCLLGSAAVMVGFDTRVGQFVVRGDDRAAVHFAAHFPAKDPVALWKDKGLDVAFSDSFTEEIYRGEIARVGPGIQPAGMALELYDYQRVDVAIAVERSGLLVAHSMGVGKTATAAGTAHELMTNRGLVNRTIIVVPPALRTQWKNELVRFTGCDPDDVVVVAGDKKRRLAAYELAKTRPYLVVHYQAIILPDDKKLLAKLVPGSLIIADEVHRAKNNDSATAKVLCDFAKKASRRLGLSGTPVENNPGEWFNIMSGFTMPGVFGSPIDFLNRYSYPGRFGGFEGAKNTPELRDRSKCLYVRRRLEDVASHLPKMRIQTIMLEPRPEYAAVLKRAHREARDEIAGARVAALELRSARKGEVLDGNERDEAEAGAEMTATGLLKALCCSPRLVALSESPAAEAMRDAGIVPDEDGPKLDELRTMAAEMQVNGERLVVFTESKRMSYLVAERLGDDGIRFVLFNGDVKADARDAAVTAFITPDTEAEPGPTVFISTDAGAEGLNLGRCCSTVVNLDIPWTPGRLAQRNARVRRVDSTSSSFLVVNLILAGTIESGILKMVEHKSDLADAILGESGGRAATTGRHGRNIFERAMDDWSVANAPAPKRGKAATARSAGELLDGTARHPDDLSVPVEDTSGHSDDPAAA